MLKIDGVEHDINAVIIKDDGKAYFGLYRNILGAHSFVTTKILEQFNEDVIRSYKGVKTKTVTIHLIKNQAQLNAALDDSTYDREGYNEYGYNCAGYDRNGRSKFD